MSWTCSECGATHGCLSMPKINEHPERQFIPERTFNELVDGCTPDEIRELEAHLYQFRLRTKLAIRAPIVRKNENGN